MPAPSLWDRLRRARIVQVLLVYLGASWGVLQIADVLADALSLPDWVLPVAVLLLLVGLVIILATAWVQSLPGTTAKEEAGEIPTDWQVAPADALDSLKAGKVPHLTWGRAILGGVVALSLLFGGAGGYVVATGGRSLLGPTEAAASGSSTSVAILPFQTRGEGLEVYGEGLVDLLSTNLEGLGGLRTVNAGTVVARWRSEVGDSFNAELDQALRVAGGLSARYAVRGSVVAAGPQVRVLADVYDLADGRRVGGAQVEGASDAMLELVDALTVDLAQLFVGSVAGVASTSLHTRSLPALEAYLRGEALYRQSRFREAVAAFDEAVVADTLFALAYRRLGMSWGWLDVGNPRGAEAGRRAAALADRLPPRERLLARSENGMWTQAAALVSEVRAHLRLHPEDGEAWEQFGEFAIHVPWMTLSPPGEARQALERAVALQPTFTPRYFHLLDMAVAEGDAARFEELMATYAAQGADADAVRARRVQWDYYWGNDEERAAAEAHVRADPGGRWRDLVTVSFLSDGLAPQIHWAGTLSVGSPVPGVPMRSIAAAVAGFEPGAWPPEEAADGHAHLILGLLDPEGAPVRRELVAALGRNPSIHEAFAAAVLAPRAGDQATLSRAEAVLRSADWGASSPLFVGSLTLDEALRYPRAVALLREGDPEGALALLSQTLAQPGYQAAAVLLAGDAHASAGRWQDALGYWEPLLGSALRPHARLRQGRGYEALGDPARALEGYRGFLALWAAADPAHPAVVEAREAVARLGG